MMRRHSDRLADERGWVLLTTLLVLVMALGLGLAILAIADTETMSSRHARERESALTLAEGALSAQAFVLGKDWPVSQGTNVYPACPSSADATLMLPAQKCPRSPMIAASFTSPDVSISGVWQTKVRDNTGSGVDYTAAVDSATCVNPDTNQTVTCSFDANGDSKVWVRADAWVGNSCGTTPPANPTQGCQKRSIVALLQREELRRAYPNSNVITAGRFAVGPNARTHQYVCTQGAAPSGACDTSSSSTGSQVVVRCTDTTAQQSNQCTGYVDGQISPPNLTSDPSAAPMLGGGLLEDYVRTAKDNGTYCRNDATRNTNFCDNHGCPNDINRPGQIIVIDLVGTNNKCTYQVNGTVNTSANPGLLVWTGAGIDGNSLEMKGGGSSGTYWGLVIATNGCSPSNASPNNVIPCPKSQQPLGNPEQCNQTTASLIIGGGLTVRGGASIDGNGCLYFGSTQGAITFDPNGFKPPSTFGTAGLVQSTWRELPRS